MIIADAYANPSEVREILQNLGGLPGAIFVFVLAGSVIGYLVAVFVFDALPGGLTALVGGVVGLAVAVGMRVAEPPPASAPICESAPALCDHPLLFPSPSPFK